MSDTSFFGTSAKGEIHFEYRIYGKLYHITLSGKPPTCDYIATPCPDITLVYLFAGTSLELVLAILRERNEERYTRWFAQLDKASQEWPYKAAYELLMDLSPPEFPHLRILCTDRSYLRFPAYRIPGAPYSPEYIAHSAVPEHSTASPKDWLRFALPHASGDQVDEIYELYQQQLEITGGQKRLELCRWLWEWTLGPCLGFWRDADEDDLERTPLLTEKQ